MKKNKNLLLFGIIAAIAVVALSVVFFILGLTGVFEINEFLLGFMILSAGMGLVFMVYGIAVKGGYETATGYVLVVVGLTLLFVALSVVWYAVLFIDLALVLVGVLILLAMKSKYLTVERTDEKEGYKSFYEVKAEKDAAEKKREEENPVPEFKKPSDEILGDKKD